MWPCSSLTRALLGDPYAGARETKIDIRLLGTYRKFDDFDVSSQTGFEGKMVNWENLEEYEFQRVMQQIANDRTILN